MKFISYSHNDEHKFGILDNNLITDLTGKISGASTLKDLILKKGISEAIKYYQLFINQGGRDHRVFSNYGVILINLGKLKEAEYS